MGRKAISVLEVTKDMQEKRCWAETDGARAASGKLAPMDERSVVRRAPLRTSQLSVTFNEKMEKGEVPKVWRCSVAPATGGTYL